MSRGILITPETAPAMAARAAVARKAKATQTKARLELLDRLLRQAATPPEPPPDSKTETTLAPLCVQNVDSEARSRQVSKIWTQLEGLDKMIDEAIAGESNVETAQKLDRLTNSRNRLFESWRILSGIPMPGSRKPAPDRTGRQIGMRAYDPTEVITVVPPSPQPIPPPIPETEPPPQ